MIGVYDFCGHYDWTFEWLRRQGGEELVREYWEQAISRDSQAHARDLIGRLGFEGMERYWGHTLEEEQAGCRTTRTDSTFRIDMHACPSRGFLIRNGIGWYRDYCDHCMGWIAPALDEAGFEVDHEHNHRGQCWWEIRRRVEATSVVDSDPVADDDVRLRPGWDDGSTPIDRFRRSRRLEP